MHRLSSVFLGAVGAWLAACNTTPIEIRDRGATHLDGRFLYRVHEDEEDRESEPWYGVELDLARVEGATTQDLDAGDTLVFENTIFVGPTRVAQDYELGRTSLGFVVGHDIDAVSLSGVFGIGWQELELELASGAQRARGDDSWAGLLTAVEFLWAPTEWLGLDARAAWTTKIDAELRELELGATLGPRAPLGLFLGWRWVDSYHLLESESDIDLRVNGPVFGLRGSL